MTTEQIEIIPAATPRLTFAPELVGLKGDAATVAVGTVTTGAPGSSASVNNSGTSTAAVLDVTIPAGQTGATGAPGGGAQQGLVTLGADFAQAPGAAEADLPGMSLTYTAPATPVPLVLTVSGLVQHTGGASSSGRVAGLRFYDGATLIGVVIKPAGSFPATGGNVPFFGELRFTPTAGAHTFKVRAIANVSADATITWLNGGGAKLGFNLPNLYFAIDEH